MTGFSVLKCIHIKFKKKKQRLKFNSYIYEPRRTMRFINEYLPLHFILADF